MALEFLGLNSNVVITENDLEQAILDNLQQFLLELGEGWCFEGRQKRILIDEDYFKIDLVFYSRILKCHLLIELKITNEFQPSFGLASLQSSYDPSTICIGIILKQTNDEGVEKTHKNTQEELFVFP